MTKSDSAFTRFSTALLWAVPILFVFFYDLTIPLVGPDEPRYAQVAREMFERNDWITPTLGGFNWFEKPALLYWLEIASYNLFGVSEFSARFGSVLFGLGTIGALYLLGKQQDGTNNEQPATNKFSFWITLIAGSTIGIIAFSHGASFDIVLTFPMTAALVAYYLHDSGGRTQHLVAFYFFVGLALLAKGLVGIVFPIGIVGLYHLISLKLPSGKVLLSVFWGTVLAAVVAAPWYVPMYLRHGYEFIDQFFIQHHFQRYTSNKYLHPQPFYFFLWVLPLMTIPWIPFFVAALWRFGRRLVANEKDSRSSLRLFAFAWMALPVLFFSFSGSKLPGYILPAVPATIILTADLVYDFITGHRRRALAIKVVAAATFAILVVAMTFFVPSFAESDSVKSLFASANSRGWDKTPVVMLHGVSHNAEFYAPGRLVREADGKLKRLYGPLEVKREIEIRNGAPMLVLVPPVYFYQLKQTPSLTTDVVGENGEWVLVYVTLNSQPPVGPDPSGPRRSLLHRPTRRQSS